MNGDRGVARLESASGIQFSQITAARERTEDRLAERRQRIAQADADPDATVVLMGSWGRREVTSESDDDFMVLFEDASRANAQPAIDQVAEALEARAPGAEEIFGQHVWLDDLREKIGRDEDTNTNLTRRLLFLLESVPVLGQEVFARGRRALIAGCLRGWAAAGPRVLSAPSR
jgi:hypothetical protein